MTDKTISKSEAGKALSTLGAAKGGAARAKKLSSKERQEIARSAALARWGDALPQATHGTADHPLIIGDLAIPAYVLEDGRRVLSLGGMLRAMGMSIGSAGGGEGDRLVRFAAGKGLSSYISEELLNRMKSPIRFRAPSGGVVATGYEATILPDLCDAVLAARNDGALRKLQLHIAARCEILVRAFARVGIIALVDEATGYQADRARDALARILEKFIAKELRKWVKTFPNDFYREMFRLWGWNYSDLSTAKPGVVGHLTNNIVYDRLAPGVRAELNRLTPRDDKGRLKAKLFQRLSDEVGHPRLREHLAAVVALMRASNTKDQFTRGLDRALPRYGDTIQLPLEEP